MATKKHSVEPSPGDGEAWENRPSDPRPPGPIQTDGLVCLVAGLVLGGVVVGLGWLTFGNPAPSDLGLAFDCADIPGYHCKKYYTKMTTDEMMNQLYEDIENLKYKEEHRDN